MQKLLIGFEDGQAERLRETAAAKGKTVTALVREAVGRELQEQEQDSQNLREPGAAAAEAEDEAEDEAEELPKFPE